MASVADRKTAMTVSILKETAAWLREQGGRRGVGEVLDMLIQRERLAKKRAETSQDAQKATTKV